MSLPDKPRVVFSLPARDLAASAIALTRRITWRTLHPADREHFFEQRPPLPLTRLTYRSCDGWAAPIFVLEPATGGSAEPIVLAHGLGLSTDAYRYGTASLAQTLSSAGYRVYLLSHRGDREATGEGAVDFDSIVERDVPAALRAITAHAGAERVHWLGHGLGGQVGLVAAARGELIASVIAMGAPVVFPAPRSELRRASMLASLLPAGWNLPTDVFARLLVPALGAEEAWFGHIPGSRLRGVLEFGSEQLSLGLVEQISTWLTEGRLTSRGGVVDYLSTFPQADVPLLVVYGRSSRTAGQGAVVPALQSWGHPDALALSVPGRGLDIVLGESVAEQVYSPVVHWLEERRGLVWPERMCLEQCLVAGR